jgi:cell division protein FtsI/penicillin-binding protein 2
MDRQIRRLGFALGVLFIVLFLQLNNLQVLQASKLSNASGNIR